jgi:hypothetical protein
MAEKTEEYTAYPSLHQVSNRLPLVGWLWPFWIPRGMLTLLGGAPGVGKSLVALDLARRIIQNDTFPDGGPVPRPGRNILIVDSEDAPALLNQRAQAWDIDRRRLFLMLAPRPSRSIDLADPVQQLHLVKMVQKIRPALVVIDSLAGATATGETSLHGARALLSFLSSIARQANLAVLVIHHLRKRARSGRPSNLHQVVADDLRGSSHISAAARSVLALSPVGRPPTFPIPPPAAAASAHSPSPPPAERRRLEVVKTNLCRRPPPLGLLFQGENVPVPALCYSPFDETWLEHPSQPTQVSLCARWLLGFLAQAGAPVKPSDLVRAAAEQNFSRNTLYRARHALADSIVELGSSLRDPGKRWTLAEEPSPSPSPPPEEHPPR